jgi:hypothetical protein
MLNSQDRKVLLLALFMMFGFPGIFAQESLLGMKLGVKNTEANVTAYYAGIKGLLMAFELNDGRTFQIGFAPSNDGEQISRLKKSAYESIVKQMESDYKIRFERFNSEENNTDFVLEAVTVNIAYFVDVKYDPSASFPYDVMLSIVDLELEKIAITEGK